MSIVNFNCINTILNIIRREKKVKENFFSKFGAFRGVRAEKYSEFNKKSYSVSVAWGIQGQEPSGKLLAVFFRFLGFLPVFLDLVDGAFQVVPGLFRGGFHLRQIFLESVEVVLGLSQLFFEPGL